MKCLFFFDFAGASFGLQKPNFEHSYYYGSITPEGNLNLYRTLLKHAYYEFLQMSSNDTNALLMVNTLGWVESEHFFKSQEVYRYLLDFGAEILDYMINVFSPACILNLSSSQKRTFSFKVILSYFLHF